MNTDDEGDFKKARGILLTYSAIVLALWFFGANLTAFKLMGTEIHLEHRTNSVWLVLAFLNLYFWFRYFQRVPSHGLSFDDKMNELYDKALEQLAVLLNKRALLAQMRVSFAERDDGAQRVTYHSASAELLCHEELAEDAKNNGYDNVPQLHQVSRAFRTKMRLHVHYNYTQGGEWVQFGNSAFVHEYTPSTGVAWLAKGYAIMKGAFVTPWFTDNVAPLLFGGVSTAIAFIQWWLINHPA